MKGRKHERSTGGVNDAEEDLNDKPEARTNAKKIDDEAEERKAGGRAKRKAGGGVEKEGFGPQNQATMRKRGGKAMKHVGAVEGHEGAKHAGRKPRKSGGRASSDANPYSSARVGEVPKGRSLETEMD